MLTPETINVLIIAAVANGIVFLAVIGRRLRDERRARRSRRTGEQGAAVREPSSGVVDAGEPWFPGGPNRAQWGNGGRPAMGAGETPAGTTELGSPAQWTVWIEEEETRAERYHHPATVVLVELSGLDRLAERVGQAAADRLIPPVGATMRRQARAADRLAQLGPARFGVLLVETDEIRAINYIERVRSACDLWLAAGAVSLRLTIGWAEVRADATAPSVIVDAERMLFAERRRSEPAPDVPVANGHEVIPARLQTSST